MIKTFVADFGNYDLKFLDKDGAPRSIRSIHTQLPHGVNALGHKADSPIIEVDGDRHHIGWKAYQYRHASKTVTTDKELLARLHLYACLPCPEGDYRLVLSHHTPEKVESELRRLIGSHGFKRNGVQHSFTVSSVEVVPEGMGAYWLARSRRQLDESGYTIVIDIGGGTWLWRAVDNDGDLIDGGVFDHGGAYAVASQIAADSRLRGPARASGFNVDPGRVMDGFAANHFYEGTSIGWRDWLGQYVDPWFEEIKGTVKADGKIHMPRVRQFLFTGGGANLLRERLLGKPMMVFMDNPSFANVQGMGVQHMSAKNPALKAVA